MYRYFIFHWNPADRDTGVRLAGIEANLLHASPSWELAYKANGISVMHLPASHIPGEVHVLPNARGVILGSLFTRPRDGDNCRRAINFNATESERILQSAGRLLVQDYWGAYVAVVCGAGASSCSILRDPTANLACYHTLWNGVDVFFSDMQDLRDFVPSPLSVSLQHVAARLLCGNRLSRECPIREIEDVPGGEWLSLSHEGRTRTTVWHPAQFCNEDGLESETRALDVLRSTVLTVVQALASQHSNIVLRLSGGLDSSIVASCLAQQNDGPHVTCLNFYLTTEHGDVPLPVGLDKATLRKVRRIIGSADERVQARSVSQKCGFPIIEREKRIDAFDVRRIYDAPLAPRPTVYACLFDEDEFERELVVERSATACFSGNAGDTVFYNTQRALAPVDYAYLHPLGTNLLHHINAAASLSGDPISQIIGQVLKHGLCRVGLPFPYDPFARPHLLTDEISKTVSSGYFQHPWEQLTSGLCPGKRSHVAGVSQSLFYPHTFNRDRVATSVHPLVSQPVVETCLRIPTYVLLMGGVSRGLARRAFSDLLPADVVRRTVKGSPIAFWQRAIRQNIAALRDFLFGGTLVRERVLDRKKLEEFLTDDQPFLTVQADQILDYLECEAWVNQVACT